MFAENPERVTGFIIQNGTAYEEGLGEFWDPLRAYWAGPSVENGNPLRGFLEIYATKWQFTHGTQEPDAINPDNFWHVQYLLDRPGNQEVPLEMFLDYDTNVAEYPRWQALFREHQTPTLLMWGKIPGRWCVPLQARPRKPRVPSAGHRSLRAGRIWPRDCRSHGRIPRP